MLVSVSDVWEVSISGAMESGERMIIQLPQVGESVTEGTIVQWLKQVGDHVDRYDALVEVLTDKVSMEMPSPVAGVITDLLADEGQTVSMGAPIAAIEPDIDAGVDPSADASSPSDVTELSQSIDRTGVLLKDVAPVGPTGAGAAAVPVAQDAVHQGSSEDARPRRRYSPAVQRLAGERGIDLSLVRGTGINGRITRKDVLEYSAAQVETAASTASPVDTQADTDEERLPLTPLRRMVAANMKRSASEIPVAWSITEVDVSGLVRRREALKDEFQRREGVNLTYLHFVIKAVAESLRENPLLNSSWDEDAIVLKKRINVGVAVAAPDGLVVPTLRDADALSVAGIAVRVSDLTARARQGRLGIEDVQSGTFTVNNTGALGSVASQPIINYPQAAILTTEAVVKRPVAVGDAIAIRSMMNICLTFDHRIMDGAEASAFTNGVKRRLEAISNETGIY